MSCIINYLINLIVTHNQQNFSTAWQPIAGSISASLDFSLYKTARI